MKLRLLFLLAMTSVIVSAQDFNSTLTEIREAEAKSALQRIMHRSNLNTGNYDLKYHRLELHVDRSRLLVSVY